MPPRPPASDPWAAAGAADLTGRHDGPPLLAPEGVGKRIEALGARAEVDALSLLTERAAYLGLSRNGSTSCGGACRLLPAADGWVAVKLARPDDVASVPAWLEIGPVGHDDPWSTVTAEVAGQPTARLVERATLLSLPVAAVGETPAPVAPAAPTELIGAPPLGSRPLVVDLSSLWAGPLCGRILADAGADVVKVESTARPDGSRPHPDAEEGNGHTAWFNRLNEVKDQLLLDLDTPEGAETLRGLLDQAQVVIESARPRALDQRGLHAETLLKDKLGPSIWVSITGYGRASDRVAFGDDAAAAGALVAWDGDRPLFAGDAIADPLAGIAAAGLVRTALTAGGRWMLDVPMAQVSAWVAAGAAGQPWTPT